MYSYSPPYQLCSLGWLQIKSLFCYAWSIFDWIIQSVGDLVLLAILSECLFELILQTLKWNFVWLFIIMSYKSSVSFAFGQYLTELLPLDLKFSWKFVFWTFFELICRYWNDTWYDLFTKMSYRLSLSFVVIDQYLTKLSPLDLEFSWKFLLSDNFLIDFSDIERRLGMIAYNNEIQINVELCIIGQYLTKLWPLDLEFSQIYLFSGHF
jgi:hypothetical protein